MKIDLSVKNPWLIKRNSELFSDTDFRKNKMQMPNQDEKISLSRIDENNMIVKESNSALLPLAMITGYNELVPRAAEILFNEYIERQKQLREIEMMEAKDRQRRQNFVMFLTVFCLISAAVIGTYMWQIGLSVLFISVLPKIIYLLLNPSAEYNSLWQSIIHRISKSTAQKE